MVDWFVVVVVVDGASEWLWVEGGEKIEMEIWR